METKNPATPAQAATPGSGEQGNQNQSGATQTPPTGGQGGQQEGTVTISTKEFAALARDRARLASFEKRKDFFRRNPGNPASTNDNGDGNDPELVEALHKIQESEATLRRDLLKERVTNKVRDLLDKDEFKVLPKSTRDLILKNPAMLSQADNEDEAMLDIEDFVREQVAGLTLPSNQPANTGEGANRNANPPGHETPSKINAGSPAPTTASGLEDVSNLTGGARSRAILRNKIKEAKGVK